MPINWIDLGENLGKKGPDDGIVLYETELAGMGRVIIEKKIHLVTKKDIFAVTTVVYGLVITTSYFSNHDGATEHVDAIKVLLQAIAENTKDQPPI